MGTVSCGERVWGQSHVLFQSRRSPRSRPRSRPRYSHSRSPSKPECGLRIADCRLPIADRQTRRLRRHRHRGLLRCRCRPEGLTKQMIASAVSASEQLFRHQGRPLDAASCRFASVSLRFVIASVPLRCRLGDVSCRGHAEVGSMVGPSAQGNSTRRGCGIHTKRLWNPLRR